MRKGLYIIIAAASALMFGSCAGEEPVSGGSGNGSTTGTGEAYLKVNITTPDGETTRGEDGGFMQDDLYFIGKVKTARFFFFDQDGYFLTEGTLWNGGTTNSSTTANVEYFGNKVLALKDAAIKPSYVMAVLNAPDGLEAPERVTDLDVLKVDGISNSEGKNTVSEAYGQPKTNLYGTIIRDSDDNIYPIMTSASYNSGEITPYVTAITSSSIKSTAEEAEKADPVEIYVERLAAMVKVDMSKLVSEKGAIANTNPYSKGLYLFKPENVKVEGWDGDVYFRIQAWEENAVNPGTYLMKHIDTSWSDTYPGFTWNDPTNKRSYWGKSMNYGDASANYPDSYTADMTTQLVYHTMGHVVEDAYGNRQTVLMEDGTDAEQPEIYGHAFTSPWFISENTNTSEIVTAHSNSAITSVLIKAEFVHKNTTYPTGFESEAEESVIKYNGKYYTLTKYLEVVFNTLKNQGKLNYNYGFANLSTAALCVVSDDAVGNGRVKVALKSNYASNVVWYDSKNNIVSASKINEELASFNADYDAVGYKRGLMYWSVPIQHLNNADVEKSGNKITKIPEGKYGVVRNHCYNVQILDITKPGQGVWVPDEPIVPNPDDDSNSLKAKINVLSWKVALQKTEL